MADFKAAMKEKDEIRKNTITMVRAAIKQIEIDTKTELSDDEILPIISKQVKMRKDALADFERGGRTDLMEVYKQEIEVLNEYLPKQLTPEEIESLVAEAANEIGVTSGMENMGKLMGASMSKCKGLADGSDVKDAVMKFLKK